jgi:hypothetical protein
MPEQTGGGGKTWVQAHVLEFTQIEGRLVSGAHTESRAFVFGTVNVFHIPSQHRLKLRSKHRAL